MSIHRLYAPLLAVALMAAGGFIQGCSSGGGVDASAPAAAAAKADVTVAAAFPASAAATKSLIPIGTKAIYVYFGQDVTYSSYTNPGGYALKLTAASPSGTLKMAPGTYYVYAAAFDSDTEDPTTKAPSGKRLSQASTAGVINLGSNIVNLTFMDGVWTTVDASGNASPIVLSDGTQLIDMVVGGSQMGYPAKAVFDFSKPILGGSGLLKYRFNNNTSARSYGNLMSQFIGTDNSTAVFADQYNLTQKCSKEFNYMLTPCDPAIGDRLVMLKGAPAGTGTPPDYYSDSYSGILTGSAYALLPNKGNTSFTQNGVAIDLKSKIPAATVSGGNTITGNMMEVVVSNGTRTLVTAPAKPVTAKIVQAQSSNTPYTGITATDYDILICSPTSSTNTGTWRFQSKAMKLGNATCYRYAFLQNFDPATGLPVTPNAGDYSYGLAPADVTKLGEYCHQFDYQNKKCLKQKPDAGDIYSPYNFYDLDGNKVIDYGSFKLNFWVQETMSGTIYVYPFTAKGKAR